MNRFIAISLTSLSIIGYISPSLAQVVEMESTNGAAWGACGYVKHQLICNTDATQTFANGRQITGLYMYNCKNGKMAVKDFTTTMNGVIEEENKGETEVWDIETEAERKFVQEKCRNFEVASGGEDGLLADRYYEFKYTTDGRLTCKDTRDNSSHPLQRCRDALKTR